MTKNVWRMGIYIHRDMWNPQKAHWLFQTEQFRPVRDRENHEINNSIEVPVGRWFQVEIFWKIHPTNGELEFKIDSEKVFDFRGRTEHRNNPLPLKSVSYLKNFRSRSWLQGNRPTYHIYDDFELWTDRPPQSSAGNGSHQADIGPPTPPTINETTPLEVRPSPVVPVPPPPDPTPVP